MASRAKSSAATDPDSIRARIEAKREKLNEAKTTKVDHELDASKELETATLLAEEAELDRELAAAQAASTKTAIANANSGNMSAIEERMRIAAGDAPAASEPNGSES